MARELGRYPNEAQILTYPMLNWRTGCAEHAVGNPATGKYCWTRAQNRFAWAALGGGYAADDERRG